MFDGFSTRTIATQGATINLRTAGDGPPLLLLHGYPQTHAMWHAVAPELARDFTVVCPDLRGYGDSSKPPAGDGNANYAKRAMAEDMVDVMAALGFERFAVAGHDRGGRVTYRLALDHPGAVTRAAVLDVVPTHAQWNGMNWRGALAGYHWLMLAQPSPLPERLIGGDPMFYLHDCLARWAAPGFAFEAEAMAEYERCFANPETVRASCDDYRAGATIDYRIDEADFGKAVIECPLLVLYGERSIGQRRPPPLDTWREWARDVRGQAIPSGHFIPEEAPAATIAAFRDFFGPV